MLLAEPRYAAEVSLAEGVDVLAWDALMWLVSRERLAVAGVAQDDEALRVIHAGWEIAEATSELTIREVRYSESDESALEDAERRDAARHRARSDQPIACPAPFDGGAGSGAASVCDRPGERA